MSLMSESLEVPPERSRIVMTRREEGVSQAADVDRLPAGRSLVRPCAPSYSPAALVRLIWNRSRLRW
jgi:hypothetical protein